MFFDMFVDDVLIYGLRFVYVDVFILFVIDD